MTCKTAATIAALLLGAMTALGQDRQELEAQALLAKLVATVTEAKTLHVRIDRQGEVRGRLHRSSTESHATYTRDGADRVRYEVDEAAMSLLVAWNGQMAWRANPDLREYSRHETKELPRQAGTALRTIVTAMDGVLRVQSLPSEQVDGVRCAVLAVQYQPPAGASGVEFLERRYWVDPARGLVLREDSLSKGKLLPARPFEEIEIRHRTNYTWLTVGEAVDSSLFAWQPPAGYREVNR